MGRETALPATSDLRLECDRGVLRIWLDRPRARNALSARMARELGEVLDAVRDDRGVRAIVLRGSGGTFCAGGDLKDFEDALRGRVTEDEAAEANRAFGALLTRFDRQPQVTLALVEGAAIGGGLGLACCADVTLTTRDAQFRLSETSLGLPPAQIAPFVLARVGLTAARRLMLTGAPFDGEQAVALGIAFAAAADSEDLEARCDATLELVRACAPGAVAVTKSLLFEALGRPREEALDLGAQRFAQCLLGPEGREGLAAFAARRRPRWADDES